MDWAQPWLQPYRALGEAAAWHAAQGLPVHEALAAVRPMARADDALLPRFAAQASLPPGTPYESHVFATGTVPMRDHVHDFFNGLAWLQFPATKRRLNALHAQAIAASNPAAPRGRLRDVLTVFDENGALLLAPAFMWDALRARDWQALFLTHRAAWSQARLVLFGHGLLEKLLAPRKPITAHVLPAPQALESIAQIDHWLADAVGGPAWLDKPFAPLPVLGVPHWHAGNVDHSFYDDPLVFRRAGRSYVPQQRTLPRAA
ncbi:hypothetical protein ASF43_14765 [Pseudorhodoferax sp. Leaf267]|nr:hypothetical protein ASF43_14765 [Pseudorhodoferax sp. Leaf267]